MKHPITAGLAVLVSSLTVQGAEPKTGPDTPAAGKTNPNGQWRSEPPADCPFKPSASLTGIEFTGRHSDYRCGDTFYPSWAGDGNLYSPWTDGKTDGLVSQSGKGMKASKMTPVNQCGEPTGESERIWFGKINVDLKAFAPASFVLE